MRKRAQRRSKPIIDEPKHIVQKTRIEQVEKKPKSIKKYWVAITLVCTFFLVLYFNAYFNVVSEVAINPEGKDFDKFYLSGPDPYYNMRLVEQTLYGENPGEYPYYSEFDPLLNYPLGRTGARPPLLNMMAIGFSRLLTPFMDEIDAVGYSMQFIPALFGALLVFPVYFLGKTLFNKKTGLLAAFLIALIPIHIASGHGSAYSLFDHDSFNLLLYFFAFLFLILGIKNKDPRKSILYAILSGVAIGALSMTWVEGQFLYVIVALYVVIQMIIDIFTSKMDMRVVYTGFITLFTGYLISLPIRVAKVGGTAFDIPFFLCLAIGIFGVIYYIIYKKKIPWTISLPTLLGVGCGAYAFLFYLPQIISVFPFFARIEQLRNIVMGGGIYGSKVASTIAEASTHNISQTIMSFGPALYWLAWVGLLFLCYGFYKNHQRRDYLFIIILFLVNIWLMSTSGRFMNDIVPVICLLSAWIIWIVVDRVDYKQMIRNIRSAGGGFHGIRRGVNFFHILGVLFVIFLILLPNAYLTFTSAVPQDMKKDVFGELPTGGFGSLGASKETYWIDAYYWLSQQDLDIENPVERPAVISWWDYGFYEVAAGEHPTVADNFQDGIPPAANFHTALSENEAVIIWTIRLMEGNRKDNDGKLSDDVVEVLNKHIDENASINITNWVENPISSPSYNTHVGEEYDEEMSKEYTVGSQYPMNAVYHDIIELLLNNNDSKLDEEEIIWLYHDIQEATGYSIRYYAVEGYDEIIFNIFAFLSDKSIYLVNRHEDDFVKYRAKGYIENVDGTQGEEREWTNVEIRDLTIDEQRRFRMMDQWEEYKEDYFNTMFYNVYIGAPPEIDPNNPERGLRPPRNQYGGFSQSPCAFLRHFYPEYLAPVAYQPGRSAVVIAKYYAGAFLNGSIKCKNDSLINTQVVLYDNFGVAHDNMVTGTDGTFSIIAPAGNFTFQISQVKDRDNRVILKTIYFNDTAEEMFRAFTDDEAMRLVDYTRDINITIDPSTIEGFVYDDKNNNRSYDLGIDEPLSGITINLKSDIYISLEDLNAGNPEPIVTDEKGYYNFTDIYPSIYTMSVIDEEGFEIHNTSIIIEPGHRYYNISKPKLSAIEGKVYYDGDFNGVFDSGEEMSDVNIDLRYARDNRLIEEAITDADGAFSFSNLIPGEYIINATKNNEYNTEEYVTLIGNKTTYQNISIGLTKAILSGYTRHDGNEIGDIMISFMPDISVENNTAEPAYTNSNTSTGYYSVALTPGTYNISAVKSERLTPVYSYEGSITIARGAGTTIYPINLDKLSKTISGTIKDNDNNNIDNITVIFTADISVENNTAIENDAMSDENGFYQIELTSGHYLVTIVEKTVIINGQNVTYSSPEEELVIPEEIETKIHNIVVTKDIE